MGGGPIGLSAVRILKILGYGPIALYEPVAESETSPFPMARTMSSTRGKKTWISKLCSLLRAGSKKTFECSGVKTNVDRALILAADNGEVCIVSVIFSPLEIAAPYLINFKEIRLTASISNTHAENIQCLNWMAEGKLDGRRLISDYERLECLPAVYREKIDTGLAVKALFTIGEEF